MTWANPGEHEMATRARKSATSTARSATSRRSTTAAAKKGALKRSVKTAGGKARTAVANAKRSAKNSSTATRIAAGVATVVGAALATRAMIKRK
jgi:hypothetical protein